MATTNPTITATGAKIADANADFFLSLPWKTATTVEWATTATPGTAPTVEQWHRLRGYDGDQLNRAIIGNDLEVWLRSPDGSVVVVLD